jgi:predicted DNA-binding transcriptional regulator AlpA
MSERYLRVAQIIGRSEVTREEAEQNRLRNKGPKRAREALDPIVPVSHSTWWAWVKAGKVPAPTYLGRLPVWPASVIEQLGKEAA